MRNKLIDSEIFQYILMSLVLLSILGWLIWTIYASFWLPEKPGKQIVFNVTGVTGSMNASSLVMIHYECMKYCIDEYGNYGMSVADCWDQCALLGKEGCK